MNIEELVSRAKWQEEEDASEDVKDNWEDEDEEPPKPAPVEKKPANKGANKKSGPNKSGATDSSEPGNSGRPLTAQELRDKRLQEEKLQKESDLKLTKQMLGMEDKDIALEFPLNTKEDFDRFHKNLVHKLWCYDKSPHYYLLLDKLFRDLCVPLEADELKNLSATVNALFNEKVKVNKAKPKKKSSKGVAIKMERNNLDRNDYVDELDDIM